MDIKKTNSILPIAPQTVKSRRDFLHGGSLAMGLFAGMASTEIRPARAADEKAKKKEAPPSVGIGLIGCGDHGRDILNTLSRLPGADVKVVCDNFEGVHKRALGFAPKAQVTTDYKALLTNKDVKAVFLATPSHLHREMALAALQAGKHLYCEAPLAHTIDEAKVIARAALANPKLIFQPGLQRRANTLDKSVFGFVKAGVLAKLAQADGRFSSKNSWRRAASTPEREKERNWRLSKATSGGLFAEVGIHQLDWMSWFMRSLPKSVTASGNILGWNDGRENHDTVRCELEYPGGLTYTYRATLVSSMGGTNDSIQGMNASVLMRANRAWMIKETDAPALGWEVYATKEPVGDDSGIALVANATKLLDEGKDPAESRGEYALGPLHYSIETFLEVVRGREKPTFGAQEGFDATVVALKANEAAFANKKIDFKKEWFSLA